MINTCLFSDCVVSGLAKGNGTWITPPWFEDFLRSLAERMGEKLKECPRCCLLSPITRSSAGLLKDRLGLKSGTCQGIVLAGQATERTKFVNMVMQTQYKSHHAQASAKLDLA